MKQYSVRELNALLDDGDPNALTEAEINKATGIEIRARQQTGVPRSAETRRKISEALKGRRLSAETRAKISSSKKMRHLKG